MRSKLFLAALAAQLGSVCFAMEPMIDEQTARKLLEDALPAIGESRTSVTIGQWRFYWAPEFYTFSAYRSGEIDARGIGILQTHYFAVNPWTGDVWEGIECRKLSTPALKKDQDEIWKRSGIPSEARETIAAKAPGDCSSRISTRVGKKK